LASSLSNGAAEPEAAHVCVVFAFPAHPDAGLNRAADSAVIPPTSILRCCLAGFYFRFQTRWMMSGVTKYAGWIRSHTSSNSASQTLSDDPSSDRSDLRGEPGQDECVVGVEIGQFINLQ
jgi:hypothetical protein